MAFFIFYNLDLDATNETKKTTRIKPKFGTGNYNCSEPCNSSKSFSDGFPFLSNNSVIVDNQQSDAIWFLLKTLSPALGKMVPTWAAYNSLMGQKKPITNVAMMPIINGSPTERENLYASIKEAEKLRRKIFKDGKTIISFDLQLYINAIQLQERSDIQNSFVFRMGELQVVFCVLKVIGKLIDGNGLDQVFNEAVK